MWPPLLNKPHLTQNFDKVPPHPASEWKPRTRIPWPTVFSLQGRKNKSKKINKQKTTCSQLTHLPGAPDLQPLCLTSDLQGCMARGLGNRIRIWPQNSINGQDPGHAMLSQGTCQSAEPFGLFLKSKCFETNRRGILFPTRTKKRGGGQHKLKLLGSLYHLDTTRSGNTKGLKATAA